MERDQEKLNEHVAGCKQCIRAKHLGECCQIGRVLARIIESKATR